MKKVYRIIIEKDELKAPGKFVYEEEANSFPVAIYRALNRFKKEKGISGKVTNRLNIKVEKV